jgi:UrcA family protein
MVRKLLASTALFFSLGLGTAFAGPTTVTFGDLNLGTSTGSATLASRIQTAATAYCATPTFQDRHVVAPAFAESFTKNCVKQVSRNALYEIRLVTGTPVLLALN